MTPTNTPDPADTPPVPSGGKLTLRIAESLRTSYLHGKHGDDMTQTIHELRDFCMQEIARYCAAHIRTVCEAVIGQTEEITRIDRKTDNDIVLDARNELRAEQRTRLNELLKEKE